jgi:hypothetical protein
MARKKTPPEYGESDYRPSQYCDHDMLRLRLLVPAPGTGGGRAKRADLQVP